ncbi:MAG: effector binding domain-containing protein [Flavobacteriales bacterium]|nr:effector binding domain-containing protein [Flavobacteriales bacterium]
MKKVKVEPFKLIGITIKTTNDNEQSNLEIQGLWKQFMEEGVLEQIPTKLSSEVYSLYTHYEGDHTQPYSVILGCKVSSLEEIPEGMVGEEFEGGTYWQFTYKGDLMQGLIYQAWMEIWEKELNRDYVADFEIFGEKAQNPSDAEVDIFVGVKE